MIAKVSLWEANEYVVCVNGRPLGRALSKSNACTVVSWLNSLPQTELNELSKFIIIHHEVVHHDVLIVRKKPVEITVTAKLWDGTKECFNKLNEWIAPKYPPFWFDDIEIAGYPIDTLEGKMIASVGDYIIKGINGEFYPCKPDIFHKTYDIVKEGE